MISLNALNLSAAATSLCRRYPVVLMLVWLLAGCDGGSALSANREAPALTGTILMEQGTRVDQDTAVDILEGTRIDALQSPPLPGDVLLAGFVSHQAGDYPAPSEFFTPFPYPQDPEDAFQLPMLAGQGVSLRFFNALRDDSSIHVNTRLVGPDGGETVDQESDPSSPNRVLVAQQDGLHTLHIETTGGPPLRYLISTTPATTNSMDPVSGAEFILGEAIVTLVEQPIGLVSSVQSRLAPVSQRILGDLTRRWQMPAQRGGISEHRIGLLSSTAPGADRQATLEWIRELQEDPTIASASPNYVVRSLASSAGENDFLPLQKWHYGLVELNAPAGEAGPWASGLSGSGIRVAVLDTGVFSPDGAGNSWHPDLDDNIQCSTPFTENCFNAINPQTPPLDSGIFHGTHVAGTVAASFRDNGRITGVAFNAQLIPVKVLENLEGSIDSVIAGVNWVVNDGNPRADIINMSLGTSGDSPGLREAIERARQAGIVVVAAAGNDASRRQLFPAAYDSVLAVGAVDCIGQMSEFSNFGFWLDLVAPGGGGGSDCGENQRFVWSAGVDEDQQPATVGLLGTSMASPHVAGALALLLENQSGPLNREHLPAIIAALNREQRLHDVVEQPFSERRGRGLLDTSSLLALGDRITDLAVLVPDQRQIVFTHGVDSQTLEFRVAGNPQDSITEVIVNGVQDWFTVDSMGDNRFRIQLLRNAFPPDTAQRGDLQISYKSAQSGDLPREFSLPVSVQVPVDESQRNAGRHYVQLIPVDSNGDITEDDFHETIAEAVDGRYQFRFDPREIPPGDYLLIAGTDIDNNGLLCEDGEACSEFPETGGAQAITITPETRKTVTMTTRYLLPVSSQSTLGSQPRQQQ
ncbi:MAG: hypothetical protein EA349_07220 [Halomonadaceae bacterium]|nr:MAG: hypothetical protein EA349_07220 [Halomonadaceae bacterium]